MKWTLASYLYPACGLAIAVLTISMDLSPTQGLIALGGGFIVLSIAQRALGRRLNRQARRRDAERVATASALELNILHAYREPKE